MPANGETVTFDTLPSIPVDMSLSLLKRHNQQACESPLPRGRGWIREGEYWAGLK